MFRILLIAGSIIFLAGCAQAMKDYQTGLSTPLTNAETQTTQQQAAAIGNAVATLPVPFAPVAGGVVTFLAGIFLAWHRGVVIRQKGTVTASAAEKTTVATGIIQDLANVFAGAFSTTAGSTSTAGAVWQRVWKTLLATITGGGVALASDPSLVPILAAHPVAAGILAAVPSLILGLEKAFSNVPAIAAITP